jgi:class 3 adenylate cyclase
VAKIVKPQLHEQLRELLPKARAESCQVVATFLDIRGFSTFAVRGESFDAALYLRSVYSRILGEYFPDADFFKPTGDGLLLIHVLPDDTTEVPTLINAVVSRCAALVDDFGLITKDDYMVSPPVPKYLGVGIARGPATRLVSGTQVLDYTGRCLNLAARLMDKARPSGLVFGDDHAARLLTDEVRALFRADAVCVRGIAEQAPVGILVTSSVSINPADREPASRLSDGWGESETMSVEDVRTHGAFSFYLPRKPRKDELACVEARYPVFDAAGKRKSSVQTMWIDGTVAEYSDGFAVQIPFKQLIANLKDVPAVTQGMLWNKTTYVTFTPRCKPKAER